jgi:hypothetical protein
MEMQREVETLLMQGQGDSLLTTGNESPLLGSDLDQSRNLIADYSTNYRGFRERNRGVDDFFTEIELNKYLARCRERTDNVLYNNTFGQNHTWRAVIKNNKICLDAAALVLKNAKEQFEKFKRVSMDLGSKQAAEIASPKKRSFLAKTFNLGREAKYNGMTKALDIPSSLYFVSLYLAYAFLLLELKLTRECEALYANGNIRYTKNTERIVGITQLYPYSPGPNSSDAEDYSDYKPDVLNALLRMVKTNPSERDIEELRNYINTQVDTFMASLQPSAGGRRTCRRSSSRKSRRGKKRVTKHRVRRHVH